MTNTTVCKAEEKLEEVGKKDFVENLKDYKKDEFLRKQLADEADVEIINLRNVLYSIKNNFEAYSAEDYTTLHDLLNEVSDTLKGVFSDISSETAF